MVVVEPAETTIQGIEPVNEVARQSPPRSAEATHA
jgi:hypothetical protein